LNGTENRRRACRFNGGVTYARPAGPITEASFWRSLEFRLCAETRGGADLELRHYWCDGIGPGEYLIGGRRPRIVGVAWFGATGQEQWEYELRLRKRHARREEIDWALYLPPENVTGWLSVDVARRRLMVDPMAGVPDERRLR